MKRHQRAAERFCVWQTAPTFGPRDEITGWRFHKVKCFRSRKKAQALASRTYSHEELQVFVRSTKVGPHGWSETKPVALWRRPIARTRAQRAWKHDPIPF